MLRWIYNRFSYILPEAGYITEEVYWKIYFINYGFIVKEKLQYVENNRAC